MGVTDDEHLGDIIVYWKSPPSNKPKFGLLEGAGARLRASRIVAAIFFLPGRTGRTESGEFSGRIPIDTF